MRFSVCVARLSRSTPVFYFAMTPKLRYTEQMLKLLKLKSGQSTQASAELMSVDVAAFLAEGDRIAASEKGEPSGGASSVDREGDDDPEPAADSVSCGREGRAAAHFFLALLFRCGELTREEARGVSFHCEMSPGVKMRVLKPRHPTAKSARAGPSQTWPVA